MFSVSILLWLGFLSSWGDIKFHISLPLCLSLQLQCTSLQLCGCLGKGDDEPGIAKVQWGWDGPHGKNSWVIFLWDPWLVCWTWCCIEHKGLLRLRWPWGLSFLVHMGLLFTILEGIQRTPKFPFERRTKCWYKWV